MAGNGKNLPRKNGRRGGERAPKALPVPPEPAVEPPPCAGLESPPQRTFRALQNAIRLGIWDYATDIGYNPWHALIAMALLRETPLELKFDCHKEVAQYLLPKLASIKVQGEVEHHHTSEPLQVLFAKWEQEEEAERVNLPPWTPPGLEALDMRQQPGGEWDLDDEDEVED